MHHYTLRVFTVFHLSRKQQKIADFIIYIMNCFSSLLLYYYVPM